MAAQKPPPAPATPQGPDAHHAEDEEEPKLKYIRLGSSASDILKRDSATCMAVHEKFLVPLPARYPSISLLGTPSPRRYG